jgi:hypothetical protein
LVDNPVWEICERVAEVQALLDDGTVTSSAGHSSTYFARSAKVEQK